MFNPQLSNRAGYALSSGEPVHMQFPQTDVMFDEIFHLNHKNGIIRGEGQLYYSEWRACLVV